jgi:hypothetical protein
LTASLGLPASPCLVISVPDSRTAERRYVFDVVLREWLGIDYRLTNGDERGVVITLDGDPRGRELTLPDHLLATKPDLWLTRESLPSKPLIEYRKPSNSQADAQHLETVRQIRGSARAMPVIFGDPSAAGSIWERSTNGIRFNLDVFGSVFFLLTRYEEIANPMTDKHGRYPAGASLAASAGFLDRPVLDEYVDLLWNAIQHLWPGLRRASSQFRLRLTHDVDIAWAIHGRSAVDVAHALAGDFLTRRDPELASRRLLAAVGARSGRTRPDPYDTFDDLMEISERHGLQSTFYFMAGITQPAFDGRYSLLDPPMTDLLRRIHRRGHEVGLHASYGTHLDPEVIRVELEALKSACETAGFEQGAWGVRQHYLRFQAPYTWRSQERAGLDHDSTLGFADQIGFRAGTSREFPVFDVLSSRALQIRERPLLLMDGTLFDYMDLSFEEAALQAVRIVDAAREHRGDAVVLYHNHTVAGIRPATHYRELVDRLARSE